MCIPLTKYGTLFISVAGIASDDAQKDKFRRQCCAGR